MEDLTEIRVSPTQLVKSAEILDKTVSKAFIEVNRMAHVVKSTENCFVGKAGDAFRKGMYENIENWKERINDMKDSITGLQKIAKEYREAEGENRNAIDGNIL